MATSDTSEIPDGFVRGTRTSPVTKPWEPIYVKQTGEQLVIGLRVATPHTNSRGILHGGLIATLADNAMGLSCGMRMKERGDLLTISLNIDYLGPVKIGQWLAIEPAVVKVGGSVCFAQCVVTADGEPCARANATFKIVKPKPA